MVHRWSYSTWRGLVVSVSLLSLVAMTGCWQEVEYAEPPRSADSPEAPTTKRGDADVAGQLDNAEAGMPPDRGDLNESAEQFAEDLAESLAAQSPEETGEVASTSPSDAPPAAEPSTEDDFLFAPTTETIEPADPRDELATSNEPAPLAEQTATETATPPSDEPSPLFENDPLFEEPIDEVPPPELDTPPQTGPDQASNTGTTTAAPSRKVLHAAWLLGSKLSLAALAHGRGAAGDEVQKWMEQARTLGQSLGIEVPALPPRPLSTAGQNALPENALEYLFAAGQQMGGPLAKQYGPEAAALFEMAVKSNILLVLYKPGGAAVDATADSISQAGSRAKLPAELWQPLVSLLTQQAPAGDVRQAVYRMHAEVDSYLSGMAEEND